MTSRVLGDLGFVRRQSQGAFSRGISSNKMDYFQLLLVRFSEPGLRVVVVPLIHRLLLDLKHLNFDVYVRLTFKNKYPRFGLACMYLVKFRSNLKVFRR